MSQNMEEQLDASGVVPPLSDRPTGMAEADVDPRDRRTGSPERVKPPETEGSESETTVIEILSSLHVISHVTFQACLSCIPTNT